MQYHILNELSKFCSQFIKKVRAEVVLEPGSPDWEASVLPMSYDSDVGWHTLDANFILLYGSIHTTDGLDKYRNTK